MQRQKAVRAKSAERKEKDPEKLLCADRRDSFLSFFRVASHDALLLFYYAAICGTLNPSVRGTSAAPTFESVHAPCAVRNSSIRLTLSARRDFARLNEDASNRKEFYIVRGSTQHNVRVFFPIYLPLKLTIESLSL